MNVPEKQEISPSIQRGFSNLRNHPVGVFKRYWELKDGDRAISSGKFQILFGLYIATLALALMTTAHIRSGGISGISIGLSIYSFAIAWTFSMVISWGTTMFQPGERRFYMFIFAPLLSGYLFILIIVMGLEFSVFKFGFAEASPARPIIVATLLYAMMVSVVFLRLQRRVTPTGTVSEGSIEDKARIHFDNSWKMFQMMLSLTIAVIVGILVPVALFVVEEQSVFLAPVAVYLSGVFSSFVVLSTQILYEMHFLQQAY